jgi:hypothetical protein
MVKELHADQNYPAAHDEEQSKGFLNTAYTSFGHIVKLSLPACIITIVTFNISVSLAVSG